MNITLALVGCGVAALLGTAAASSPAAGSPTAMGQPRSAFSGKPMFATYCATCHGTEGKGDGPFAKALRKPPSNLALLTQRHNGTFPREHVTKVIDGRETGTSHGSRDMPVWGDAFSKTTFENDPESVQRKIDAIVTFVETLQERPGSE